MHYTSSVSACGAKKPLLSRSLSLSLEAFLSNTTSHEVFLLSLKKKTHIFLFFFSNSSLIMSIQLAPTELLHHIFLYLPKSSLLSCAMVCRSWNSPAIQLFYENVELSEKTKKVWLHIVQQAPAAINVGIFVRKLTVSLAFSTTLSQGDFLKVISYLPFMKAIDINSSGYKLHYLAYLNKRATGCVTYLEDINTGDLFTDYQIQQYFLCAYSFRQSLKNLTLRNPNSVYLIEGQSGSALSFLNKFASLTHISIIDDIHSDENELAILMDAIQSCPKLISFSYQNNYSLPYNQDDIQQLKSPKRSLKNMKLQTVELDVSNLTIHYIRNMLIFFPTCLNRLTINMTHTDYRDWIQEHNDLFGLYLGCVKNLKIAITNANRRRYMDRKPQVIQELSRFWLFIRSIMGNRQLSCNMQFTFSKSGTKPDIVIEKDRYNMLLSYNSENILDFRACLEEFSPLYSSSPTSNMDPTLNSMLVEVPLNEKDEFDRVRCVEIIQSITLNPYPPKSISIMFPKVNSDDGCLIQLGSRQNNNAVAFEEPTILDNVLLKNINLQVLSIKVVSDLLPNIRTLKLINCKLEHKKDMYTIDIAGIAHLNELVLDVGFLDINQVLIKVELADSHTMCFILHTGTKHVIKSCYNIPTFDKSDYSSAIIIKCQKIDKLTCIIADEDIVLASLMLESITSAT